MFPKDSSERSKRKKFISTTITTSMKPEIVSGSLSHTCITSNAHIRRWVFDTYRTSTANLNYEKNKNIFDVLKERESIISAKFDGTLYWNRRDDINTCIIGFGRDGDIESDTCTLEVIREWHVEHLLKFKEVFTSEIQRARETLQSC